MQFFGVSNNDTVSEGRKYQREFEVPYPLANDASGRTWAAYRSPTSRSPWWLTSGRVARRDGGVEPEQLAPVLEHLVGTSRDGWTRPGTRRLPGGGGRGPHRVLGPALIGVYLHGSALGLVAEQRRRPAGRGRPAAGAAGQEGDLGPPQPSQPGLPGARRLELSLVTAAVAADPPKRPPFELHLSTGRRPRRTWAARTPPTPTCCSTSPSAAAAGVAVAGPDPVGVFAEPPRACCWNGPPPSCAGRFATAPSPTGR